MSKAICQAPVVPVYDDASRYITLEHRNAAGALIRTDIHHYSLPDVCRLAALHTDADLVFGAQAAQAVHRAIRTVHRKQALRAIALMIRD
jgi:hypothetical protein